MKTPFSGVARVALEEIVLKHSQPSKFGHFLTEDALNNLIEDLVAFLQTSRNLKSAGDRIIQGTPAPENPTPIRRLKPSLNR